jgi:hypothetical protein
MTHSITPREQLAWLMWCYQQGYTRQDDRASHSNWMADDPSTLTDHDIKERDHLLAMADEILTLVPPPSRRMFSITYRAMRNGKVWCEGSDPEEIRDSGGDTLLKQETYLASTGWQPWDGNT